MESDWLPLNVKQGLWPPALVTEALPFAVAVLLLVATMITAYLSSQSANPKELPLLNRPGLLSGVQARREFALSGETMLSKARSTHPGQPYRILTDCAETVIIPPQFIDEIRNAPELSFGKAVSSDFHAHLQGFTPFNNVGRADHLLQVVARKQLTRSLGPITKPLVEECAHATAVVFGESPEWSEVVLKNHVLDLVARMSSRVFLGPELCRDPMWLDVTKNYAVDLTIAADKLRLYPASLRWLLNYILPECRKVRDGYNRAVTVIEPVIQRRRELKKAAAAAGEPIPASNDAMEWAESEAEGPYSQADFQILLSNVAISTTTNLLTQTMLVLAERPMTVTALREEMTQVLRAEGWQKKAMYSMKLLDSVIKETQRLFTASPVTMRREVTKDMRLSNGLVLRKGARLMVDSILMRDSQAYENPDEWVGDRFLKIRSQPGMENAAQLSSTGPDSLGFGHGNQACPGRFFAGNELKIALCHLVMKYEWKLAPGADPAMLPTGCTRTVNPRAKILIRRRAQLELDVDALGAGVS